MGFIRIGSGKWHEVTAAGAGGGAKWTPAPTDSRGAWGDYEFAITSFAGGMMGGLEIDLIYHLKGDVVWSSVGAGDGVVFESLYPYEALPFTQVWAQAQAEINARLAAKCHDLDAARAPAQVSAPLPTMAPPTFDDFQSWMHANVVWSGSVAPPGPTPGSRDSWGNRTFQDGYAIEEGLRIHADGRIERIERIMGNGIAWQPLPRA